RGRPHRLLVFPDRHRRVPAAIAANLAADPALGLPATGASSIGESEQDIGVTWVGAAPADEIEPGQLVQRCEQFGLLRSQARYLAMTSSRVPSRRPIVNGFRHLLIRKRTPPCHPPTTARPT